MQQKTLDLRHLIRRCPDCGQRYSPESVFCPFDGVPLEIAPFDPHTDALIGQTIDGRYEVMRVLGEGGMGTVYEVKHVALGRSFAMKVLRRDLAKDEELCARFTQEARATAAIKHPNIVGISDFGTLSDGRPYFVMELLVGRTLSSIIKEKGPFDPVRGARIVAKVASGLFAAHAAGVVHRDLKPENVFLGDKGADDDVRVVDFGAAMLAGGSRLTKAGVVFGTPHYMSPEQAAGQTVDHRADIYSLGVIMYEMFSGRVPFEDDTYMGVLTQHIYVQPAPPSQFVPERARALGAIEGLILKALEKKPEDRFQTMQELEEALGAALRPTADGGAVVAEWTPPSARPARMSSAPPGPSLEQIRESLADASPPSRRPRAGWIALGVLGAFAVVIGIGVVVQRLSSAAPTVPSDRATAVVSGLVSGAVTGADTAASAPTMGIASAPTSASSPTLGSTTASVGSSSAPSLSSTATAKPTVRPTGRPLPTPHGTGEFADPWK